MVNIDTLCPGCMTVKQVPRACESCGEEYLLDSSSQALPIRTILNDRFLIGRVLGRPGGFGITYLAWDISLQTTAAIKEFMPACSVARESGSTAVIPISKEDQPVFSAGLQMFLEEARTLAQFSHPNITRIRDYFTANNTAYLVMEYHEGLALDQYARQFGHPLPEDRALEIMLPILDGLKAVHEKKFLHRDIKPQNIYLAENERPILLDFGAARYAIGDKTSTLTVMLTSGFAPFEQYHQKGCQGPWTDLYAWAATLYFLTTGKAPPDAIERQYQDNLIAPIQLNPSLSESFNRAILKTLANDYRQRPKTVSHFLNLLLGKPLVDSLDPATRKLPATLVLPETQVIKQPSTSTTDYSRLTGNSATKVRMAQKEQKSGFPKTLIVLLIVLVVVIAWKPSGTSSPVEAAQKQPPQPIAAAQPPTPEPSAEDQDEEDVILSYANMPEIEAVGGSYFPEEEESTQNATESNIASPNNEVVENAYQPPPLDAVNPAIQACSGSRIGAVCRFNAPHGALSGQCNPTPTGQLACLPAPPRRIGAPDLGRFHQARRR